MTVRRVVAWALVAAAAVALAVRIPAAVRTFDRQADYGATQKAYGGALAAADATLIDDGFVVRALHDLPPTARYALLLPPSLAVARHDYRMATVTYRALPSYLLEVLLPRTPVAVAVKGQFVVCWGGDTAPYEGRTQWYWKDAYGRAIGLVER